MPMDRSEKVTLALALTSILVPVSGLGVVYAASVVRSATDLTTRQGSFLMTAMFAALIGLPLIGSVLAIIAERRSARLHPELRPYAMAGIYVSVPLLIVYTAVAIAMHYMLQTH